MTSACQARGLTALRFLLRQTPLYNALWIAVLLCVLGGSLFIQFFVGDLPCRSCTWQRMTMLLIASVLLLNLRFGQNARNYGVILIFALIGASISIRQLLDFIPPGNPGFGPAVFGYHTYTWALLVFACSILAAGIMLILNSLAEEAPRELPEPALRACLGLAMLTALGFAAATFLQCGWDVCPGAAAMLRGLA